MNRSLGPEVSIAFTCEDAVPNNQVEVVVTPLPWWIATSGPRTLHWTSAAMMDDLGASRRVVVAEFHWPPRV
jgi:hypothetical protein